MIDHPFPSVVVDLYSFAWSVCLGVEGVNWFSKMSISFHICDLRVLHFSVTVISFHGLALMFTACLDAAGKLRHHANCMKEGQRTMDEKRNRGLKPRSRTLDAPGRSVDDGKRPRG